MVNRPASLWASTTPLAKERKMTIEERLERLEKRNKRLTAALTVMAVAMCAVVTMAATGER